MRGIEFGQCPRATIVIGLTGFGEVLAARGAIEEPHAPACFEAVDDLPHRRACQIVAPGREGKTAGFDNLDECGDGIELSLIKRS